MVTNLPQEAKQKWNEVTLTKNPEDRMRLMQEFLSLVPKHKGTEKMRAHVKRQVSQLREEIDRKKKQAKKGWDWSPFVQKAGAAQIAIIGPPNAGRSSLLKAVTNAPVTVTSYPFGTQKAVPGMLSFEDIHFQLVEVPPLVESSSEGRADGYINLSMARNSDGLLIVVDLSCDPVGDFLMVKGELEKSRILTEEPRGQVEIQRRGHGRDIQFIWEGELLDTSTDEVIRLLNEFKIRSALVRIKGSVMLDTVEDAIFGNAIFRPTLVIANKLDTVSERKIIDELKIAAKPLEVMAISAQRNKDLAKNLGKNLFNLLEIARIYTKEPGKDPAKEPIVAQRGITVGELAKMVHNDFYERFKYARIWGSAAKFPNEKVGIDRRLDDGTIIQIHV